MRKFKTVPVEPIDLPTFRKRAEECTRLAGYSFTERLWYGACINAVHAAIAWADCLCIFFRRMRYAGQSHDEAVEFYSTLQLKDAGFRQSIQRLGNIISIKNAAEYSNESLTEKDASHVMKQLERFCGFATALLPKN